MRENMKNRATIYDVAKEADVSLATVSRVVNNNAVVKQETRERVEAAMKRLGYRPNELARGLASSKTTNICIITNSNFLQYNQKIIGGVMNIAKIYNFNVFVHTVSRGITEMEDIIEEVVKKRIDGVILFKGHFSASELEMFESNEIPVVLIGTKIEDGNHSNNIGNVYVDFEKMGYELASRYLEKGIDDICLVRDHIHVSASSLLTQGIDKAFQEVNKRFENILLYENDDALQEELKKRQPSKVMVSIRDLHAFTIFNTYKDMGFIAPADYELINILDSKYLHMFRPTVSTYGIPEYDMGAFGCRMLTKLLEEKQLSQPNVEMSHFFLSRETTK